MNRSAKVFRKQTEARFAQYKKEVDQLQASAEKLGGDAKVKAEQQRRQIIYLSLMVCSTWRRKDIP